MKLITHMVAAQGLAVSATSLLNVSKTHNSVWPNRNSSSSPAVTRQSFLNDSTTAYLGAQVTTLGVTRTPPFIFPSTSTPPARPDSSSSKIYTQVCVLSPSHSPLSEPLSPLTIYLFLASPLTTIPFISHKAALWKELAL